MSVDSIADLDLSYTPPLGSPWDAAQVAAQAWARSAGPAPARRPPDGVPTVLFVCEHNAGRSQLAAGLAATRAAGRVRVLSAGTNPDAQVDEVMLASLAEYGIYRGDQVPTQLTADLIASADVIVAVKPNLGIVPADGAEPQTWTLPEPERWDVEGLRPLRDFLDQKVRTLIEELTQPSR
jgi:protein-tyrosine-phosphatase